MTRSGLGRPTVWRLAVVASPPARRTGRPGLLLKPASEGVQQGVGCRSGSTGHEGRLRRLGRPARLSRRVDEITKEEAQG